MKRVLIFVMCAAILLTGLASVGCSSAKLEEVSEQYLIDNYGYFFALPEGVSAKGYYFDKASGEGSVVFDYNEAECSYAIAQYMDFEVSLDGDYESVEELLVADRDAKFATAKNGSCVLRWLDIAPGLLYTLSMSKGDLTSAVALAEAMFRPVQDDSNDEPLPDDALLAISSINDSVFALLSYMWNTDLFSFSGESAEQNDVENYLSYYAAMNDLGYETLPASELGVSGELAKEYVCFPQELVEELISEAFGDNFSTKAFTDNSELVVYNARSYWIGKTTSSFVSAELDGAYLQSSGDPSVPMCSYSFSITGSGEDDTYYGGASALIKLETDDIGAYHASVVSVTIAQG